MARATITLPEHFIFTTELPLRITDLNYGGHLGNDSLLSILHETRVRFLNHFGFSEKDVDGYGLIMADCVVIYKSQAFYGDHLIIDITGQDFSKRALDLIYWVKKKSSGKEVARAKTRIAFFDYQQQTTVPIPEKFLQIFQELR